MFITADPNKGESNHEPEEGDKNDIIGEQQPPRGRTTTIYVIIATILIKLLIQFGNLITLVAVGRYRRLQRRRHVLITSLAMADFTVGFSGVIVLVKFARRCDSNNIDMLTMDLAIRIPILASVFHLLAMGLDKCLAITNPLHYQVSVPGNVCIWLSECAGCVAYFRLFLLLRFC